jgi:DNA-binding transcriptional LysR family regulator
MKSSVKALGQRIDLNLVVVFDAIYRARNLTGAGRGLGLSQPAMSHALARLRSILKDPLFVRLPRGLHPTPLADEMAPALMDGLAVIRGGLERKTFDPATSTRVFRIAMGELAAVVHLPHVVRELSANAPQATLHTIEIPGPSLRDALGDGEVDLGTGNYRLGSACREALLYEAEYACVVRADHPTIRSRLTLSNFRNTGHMLVKPKGASPHGEDIERALSSRAVGARVIVQVSHFHGIAALIPTSDLIATVPIRLAASMKQRANVKVFPPPIALPKIKVSIYWHERFHRDPGNAWLRSVYLKLFRN